MPRQRHLKLISLIFFVAIISAFLLSDMLARDRERIFKRASA